MKRYYYVWTEFDTLIEVSPKEAMKLLRRLRHGGKIGCYWHQLSWHFYDDFVNIYIEQVK